MSMIVRTYNRYFLFSWSGNFGEESEKSLGEVRDFKKIYECGNHVSLRDSSWSKQLASLPSWASYFHIILLWLLMRNGTLMRHSINYSFVCFSGFKYQVEEHHKWSTKCPLHERITSGASLWSVSSFFVLIFREFTCFFFFTLYILISVSTFSILFFVYFL